MNVKKVLNKIIDYIKNQAQGYNYKKVENKEYLIQTIDVNKLQILLNTTYCQRILSEIQTDLEKTYLSLKEREKEHKLNTSKHNEIVNKMHLITADLKIIADKKNILIKESDELHRYIKNQFHLKSHT